MRLWITVVLDSGGRVSLTGHDLSAEDVNEVFAILSGKVVVDEAARVPLPGDAHPPVANDAK